MAAEPSWHSAGRIVQRDGRWLDVPPLGEALQDWVTLGGDDALELFQAALDMAGSVDEVDQAKGTVERVCCDTRPGGSHTGVCVNSVMNTGQWNP